MGKTKKTRQDRKLRRWLAGGAAMAIALAGGLPGGAAPAWARTALVIGVADYPTARLDNPVNDARLMAKELEASGFDVILEENPDHRHFRAALNEFRDALSGEDVALFYYAGHALQVAGRNYLLPVDAQVKSEAEAEVEGIDVAAVLGRMEGADVPLNIVILDACRNNPFARSFRSAASGGLAAVDAPTGTLIAYATAPGSVAADGASGQNGIYTAKLAEAMRKDNAPIEEVFKAVRRGVMDATKGAQVPWESSSLTGGFSFRGQDGAREELARADAPPRPVAPQAGEPPKAEATAPTDSAPRSAAAPQTPQPGTPSDAASLAAPDPARDDLRWNEAVAGNTLAAYRAYVEDFPDGRHVDEAWARIGALKSAGGVAALPSPTPPEGAAVASGGGAAAAGALPGATRSMRSGANDAGGTYDRGGSSDHARATPESYDRGGRADVRPPAGRSSGGHGSYDGWVALRDAPVLASPNPSARKVMSLRQGRKLNARVTGAGGGWFLVETRGGKEGYVHGDVLALVGRAGSGASREAERGDYTSGRGTPGHGTSEYGGSSGGSSHRGSDGRSYNR